METSQMEGGLDNTILHLDTCIEFGNKSIVFPAHSLQVFNNQIQVFCWDLSLLPLLHAPRMQIHRECCVFLPYFPTQSLGKN